MEGQAEKECPPLGGQVNLLCCSKSNLLLTRLLFFQAIFLELSRSWYFPWYLSSRVFISQANTFTIKQGQPPHDLYLVFPGIFLGISENDTKHGGFQAFTGWLHSDTPSPCRYLTLQVQEPIFSQFLAGSRTWQRRSAAYQGASQKLPSEYRAAITARFSFFCFVISFNP